MKQYFALLTTDAQYADAIAALDEYSLANLPGGYATQVIRTTTETNVVIVGAWVTESQINADSRLADMRLTAAPLTGQLIHEPTEFCRGRYMNLEQFRAFGFQLLGEGLRSTQALVGDTIFIRQEKSGGYGLGTGKTPFDAVNGWGDQTAMGATFVRGNTYVGLGCNWAIRAGEAFSAVNDMPTFPTGAGDAVIHRFDFRANPGINYVGFVDTTTTSDTWTQPNAGSFPNLWTATMDNTSGIGAATTLLPLDPTLSVSDLYTNHIFGEASSQSEVENNSFSAWLNGSVLWVHMRDSTNPTGRIGRSNNFGYNPKAKYGDNTAAKEDMKFINCQYLGANNGASSGGMSSGSGTFLPKAEWLGGRYMIGCSWKPFDKCQPGTVWGRSTDGEILYDVSDLPDPQTDEYIAALVARGSDQSIWDEFTRFLHIDSAREGVYWAHGGDTNNPDDGVMSGVYATYVGTPHPALEARLNNSIVWEDADAHVAATQGGSGWLVEYLYCVQFGNAVNWYAIDDATTTQTMRDNTFSDFILLHSNQRFLSGAGQRGIEVCVDGNGPRTDGSGIQTGNVIRRGYVYDIIGDPSDQAGSPLAIVDGYGISHSGNQDITVEDLIVDRCTNSQQSGIAELTDSTYTADPAYNDTQVTQRNCLFIAPSQYFWWHRTLNWLSTSPNNIGYIDSDNNEFRYASGGNPSTDELFRNVSTTLTFSGWQAQSKSSPPGDKVSVYEPNSTTSVE